MKPKKITLCKNLRCKKKEISDYCFSNIEGKTDFVIKVCKKYNVPEFHMYNDKFIKNLIKAMDFGIDHQAKEKIVYCTILRMLNDEKIREYSSFCYYMKTDKVFKKQIERKVEKLCK